MLAFVGPLKLSWEDPEFIYSYDIISMNEWIRSTAYLYLMRAATVVIKICGLS